MALVAPTLAFGEQQYFSTFQEWADCIRKPLVEPRPMEQGPVEQRPIEERPSKLSLEDVRHLTGMTIRFRENGQATYTTGIFRYVKWGRQGSSRTNDGAHIGWLILLDPVQDGARYTNLSNGLSSILVNNVQWRSIQVLRNGIWTDH